MLRQSRKIEVVGMRRWAHQQIDSDLLPIAFNRLEQRERELDAWRLQLLEARLQDDECRPLLHHLAALPTLPPELDHLAPPDDDDLLSWEEPTI